MVDGAVTFADLVGGAGSNGRGNVVFGTASGGVEVVTKSQTGGDG